MDIHRDRDSGHTVPVDVTVSVTAARVAATKGQLVVCMAPLGALKPLPRQKCLPSVDHVGNLPVDKVAVAAVPAQSFESGGFAQGWQSAQ